MKKFFKNLHYIKPYIGGAALNIVFNIFTALFSIVSLVLMKPFLDILFANTLPEVTTVSPTMGWIEWCLAIFNNQLILQIQANGRSAGLVWVCLVIIGCFFFKNIFRYLALFVMVPVRNSIERDLRVAVFNKLLTLPLSYFSNERKGDLMSRVTVDVQEIQISVLRSIETIVRSPAMIIGSMAVMLYISLQLTLFAFLMFLVVGLVIGRIGRTLRKKSDKAQNTLGRILSQIDEAIGGLRIVQAFGAEAYTQQKFKSESDYYLSITNQMMRRRDLSSPLTEFLGICVIAALLMFGGHLVFSGQFEASTFVMFILMFYNIIEPAKSFASAYYDIQKGSAAADRLQQIIETPSTIQNLIDAKALAGFEKELEIQGLGFSYDGHQKVLDEVSFKVKKGQTIALVGVSGSGKSTLADLLPRFYDPSEGAIFLDGIDIRKYKIEDLRKQIAVVSQDAILFNDSIYNNIVFGLKGMDQKAVEEAARIANAHEFILQTENGYQTVIGDRGMKLSGGQRQRLTLARAVLRNSPILVLDEATSALDSESEKLVQEALEAMLKNRTAIVIAHRLSTIQHADEILVLQEGRIVERGRHDDLLAKNGVYNKLVELQRL